MARGMAVGEPIVSQAQTKAWDENFDGTFGEPSKERGRFVWDDVQQKLVRPGEQTQRRAIDAPVMAGRFYEGAVATDGTDIGTRAKREGYMRKHGLADADDFKGAYEQRAREKAQLFTEGFAGEADKKRQVEAGQRALGEIVEMRQADYDRLRAKREEARRRRGKGFTS
jgi:hypothetical protein